MPFQSEAQRRLLWAKHPSVARRWTKKYGSTPKHGAIERRLKKGKKSG